jgi:23S rRNA G2445 N2-methylase RlmL
MQLYQQSAKIIVTCSNRIAPYLQQEIEALGYRPKQVFKTGVELHGTLQDCIRLNLHLRCASQVLFLIGSFAAATPDDLYRQVSRIAWEEIIDADGYFSITSNVNNPTVNNTLFANVKLKDAIADRFRQQTGRRPNSGPDQQRTVLHLYWSEHTAEVFADTSGATLSKHGYRKIPGRAPMLESLAAATLLAAGYTGQGPFINPMCGSGTIAIEAAMLATGRKPGLYRNNYGFMHILGYQPLWYNAQVEQLRSLVNDKAVPAIIASDISSDAVQIAAVNAAAAGVANLIQFSQCDFADTPVPLSETGMVYFNPEYGDRLGEELALQETYKRMGDFMKQRCKGYTGLVFTGNLELAKKIGLKPGRRIEFFTSKIDCRLLRYELYSGSKQPSKHSTPANND